jgi:hypothetical protein
MVVERCVEEQPELLTLDGTHASRCHRASEIEVEVEVELEGAS